MIVSIHDSPNLSTGFLRLRFCLAPFFVSPLVSWPDATASARTVISTVSRSGMDSEVRVSSLSLSSAGSVCSMIIGGCFIFSRFDSGSSLMARCALANISSGVACFIFFDEDGDFGFVATALFLNTDLLFSFIVCLDSEIFFGFK